MPRRLARLCPRTLPQGPGAGTPARIGRVASPGRRSFGVDIAADGYASLLRLEDARLAAGLRGT
jgi:hypothetical protein